MGDLISLNYVYLDWPKNQDLIKMHFFMVHLNAKKKGKANQIRIYFQNVKLNN